MRYIIRRSIPKTVYNHQMLSDCNPQVIVTLLHKSNVNYNIPITHIMLMFEINHSDSGAMQKRTDILVPVVPM